MPKSHAGLMEVWNFESQRREYVRKILIEGGGRCKSASETFLICVIDEKRFVTERERVWCKWGGGKRLQANGYDEKKKLKTETFFILSLCKNGTKTAWRPFLTLHNDIQAFDIHLKQK